MGRVNGYRLRCSTLVTLALLLAIASSPIAVQAVNKTAKPKWKKGRLAPNMTYMNQAGQITKLYPGKALEPGATMPTTVIYRFATW